MDNIDIEKEWYVIKVATSKESKIKDLIEKKALEEEFKNKIGQVIVPKEKSVHVKNGKRILKEKSYYPGGYIILQADLDGEVIHEIKNIPGIFGFLSEDRGGLPLPLRGNEVNKLLNKFDELNTKDSEESIYIPFLMGENVKIIEGPFNSFCGSIVDINKETGKLKLEVMIFGRATNLELNSTQVEKI